MKNAALIGLRFLIAAILIQTLRYKFTGHPDSIYIFTKIGMEPWGRIGIGVLELIAGILLVVPRTVIIGSLMSFGLMSGAVLFHLTTLGVAINGNPNLFYLALFTWIFSGVLVYAYKEDWQEYKKMLGK